MKIKSLILALIGLALIGCGEAAPQKVTAPPEAAKGEKHKTTIVNVTPGPH